jgi:hypothetical protein
MEEDKALDYRQHVVVLHEDGLWRTELSCHEDLARGIWSMSYRRFESNPSAM